MIRERLRNNFRHLSLIDQITAPAAFHFPARFRGAFSAAAGLATVTAAASCAADMAGSGGGRGVRTALAGLARTHHGARVQAVSSGPAHMRPAEEMVPEQHFCAPPGRYPHASPPHCPHDSGQQTEYSSSTMPDGHTSWHAVLPAALHRAPLFRMGPEQHRAAPPGRLAHPAPPHPPHSRSQQAPSVELRMPLAHSAP